MTCKTCFFAMALAAAFCAGSIFTLYVEEVTDRGFSQAFHTAETPFGARPQSPTIKLVGGPSARTRLSIDTNYSIRHWREHTTADALTREAVNTLDRKVPGSPLQDWQVDLLLRNSDVAEAKRKEQAGGGPTLVGLTTGGYKANAKVKATHDISVRGKIVAKKDSKGTIVGPSQRDPKNRVLVLFADRQKKVSVTLREVKLV
eukprot:CAMPEP_0206584890 /NCGR_PEP_ID=MMETSP0325_2-20121206/36047_1 /ASSEMBLY_ACC=CAM_ASM_000347 /TAXON_ID=2866 /ORGANISM="Crypthecodinium cohnii, Strain Seligo" /LENGTH=201 /DNA_ID=CAMNT_0054092245 /DNA_START=26 /DNA_END=631 /DNA_ORIENTATION=-